jgi:ribosome-associated protein
MIEIADKIALDETEIAVTFIRASGPGGQNVNKVSSDQIDKSNEFA